MSYISNNNKLEAFVKRPRSSSKVNMMDQYIIFEYTSKHYSTKNMENYKGKYFMCNGYYSSLSKLKDYIK